MAEYAGKYEEQEEGVADVAEERLERQVRHTLLALSDRTVPFVPTEVRVRLVGNGYIVEPVGPGPFMATQVAQSRRQAGIAVERCIEELEKAKADVEARIEEERQRLDAQKSAGIAE